MSTLLLLAAALASALLAEPTSLFFPRRGNTNGNPFPTSHASSTVLTTSSVPASTTRDRIDSEPRTPTLTMDWNASEKR